MLPSRPVAVTFDLSLEDLGENSEEVATLAAVGPFESRLGFTTLGFFERLSTTLVGPF